jgi:hypothetical protein
MAPLAVSQQAAKSHEQCIQEVPGDWGTNFAQSWHQHEARYWACRLGVSVETVQAWQGAADERDEMAQDVELVTLHGKQLVVFLTIVGTAHCFDLRILHRTGDDWGLLWKLPRNIKGTCTGSCPAVRANIDGDNLVVGVPSPASNERQTISCKAVEWRKYTFRWNGSTFQPLN